MRLSLSKFASLALTALAACSVVETSSRDESDDDNIHPPTQVTGSFLADFENSRARCVYQKSVGVERSYEVSCRVVVTNDGEEINATSLHSSLSLTWSNPSILEGVAKVVQCRAEKNSLGQICTVETKTSSAKLEFGFNLTSAGRSRNEKTEVLLPYSVKVAAGFVPNLAIIQMNQASTPKPSSSLKLDSATNAKERNGFQTRRFPSSLMPTRMLFSQTCSTDKELYYGTGAAIYSFEDNVISHIAGSQYALPGNEPSHALRYKLGGERHNIACNDTTIFIRELTRILAVDRLSGVMKVLIDKTPNNANGTDWNNFFANNSELYYANGLDLLKVDVKTGAETVQKGFFATPTISNLRVLEGGDIIYIQHGSSENSIVVQSKAGKKAALIPESEVVIGADGLVYGFTLEIETVSFRIYKPNGEIVRKVNLDWSYADSQLIPNYFDILSIDRAGFVYAYEPDSKSIKKLDPSNKYQPVEKTLSSKFEGPQYAKILPSFPSFNSKGDIIFFENLSFSFRKLTQNKIEGLNYNGYVSLRTLQDVVFLDDQTPILGALDGVFYLGTRADEIGMGENEVGAPNEVEMMNPSALALDKKGLLYIADGSRIRTFNGETVSKLDYEDKESEPTYSANFIPALAVSNFDELLVVDQRNHRIRKISKPETGKPQIETIVGRPATTIAGGVSGDGGPALEAELSCPQDLKVISDGTMFILDGSCYDGIMGAPYPDDWDFRFTMTKIRLGTRIRKVETVRKDGKDIQQISTIFGGQKGKECGSGKILGTSTSANLDTEIESSLSMICPGIITGIAAKDNCQEKNGTIDLVITQGFYAGFGNIVHVSLPCRK